MRAPEPFPAAGPDDAADLAAGDEILQVMYWMRGEGLADAVTAADLCRWVGVEAPRVGALLDRLGSRGWVERRSAPGAAGPAVYALTSSGVKEGGRRFADEFAELTRAGHGECNDPDCDCHRTGRPEDCAHHHHAG